MSLKSWRNPIATTRKHSRRALDRRNWMTRIVVIPSSSRSNGSTRKTITRGMKDSFSHRSFPSQLRNSSQYYAAIHANMSLASQWVRPSAQANTQAGPSPNGRTLSPSVRTFLNDEKMKEFPQVLRWRPLRWPWSRFESLDDNDIMTNLYENFDHVI